MKPGLPSGPGGRGGGRARALVGGLDGPGRLAFAAVAAVGFALYFQTLFFGLTYLDDNALAAGNLPFLSTGRAFLDAFRQDVFHVEHGTDAYYRPLFTVSLAVDAHLWGARWGGWHLTSVLIHVAASCLLLRFLGRLGRPGGAALFFSLAFAVSPALTQNVAHLATRDDSLMTLFLLAAMPPLMDFGRSGGRGALARHLALFACALFSKETAALFVPVALVFLLAVERARRAPAEWAALAGGWLAVLVPWLLLRRAAFENPLALDAGLMAGSIAASAPAFLQLFGKVLLPFNLSVLPFVPDGTAVWGLMALGLVGAAVLSTRSLDLRRAAFGALWFAAFLLPSMVLQSTTMAGVAPEKRLYAPIVGVILVLLETGFGRGVASGRGWAPTVGALALLVHGAVAFSYSRHYRDRMSFWRNAVASSPRLPLARRNLGAMHLLDGDLAGAEREFRAALAINPVEPMVHNNLGMIRLKQGRLAEAEAEFLEELRLYPGYANSLFNLGIVHYGRGMTREAEAAWRKAIERNPDLQDAYTNLAILLRKEGRREDARAVVAEMRRRNFPVPGELDVP